MMEVGRPARRRRRRRGTGAARADRLARGRQRLLLAVRQPAPAAGGAAGIASRRGALHHRRRQHAAVAGERDGGADRRRSGARRAARRRGGGAHRDAGAQGARDGSAGRAAATAADDRRRRRATAPASTRWRTGFMLPTQIYPLFENALRARVRADVDAHRDMLGALCSRLSAVAAENPYAWFRAGAQRRTRSPRVAPSNRMIGFPYPKLMNAIIEVDQAAAVLMTSVGRGARARHPARSLGVSLGHRPGARSLVRLRARRLHELARHPRGGPPGARRRRDRDRPRRPPRSLQLLPGRRADRARHARHRAGRSAAAHGHRRPAVLRRARQQLQRCTPSPR